MSIFLRENLQTQQGQFIMKTNGIVPTGFQPPGEIRLVKKCCEYFGKKFSLQLFSRTYKRGRLNNTHTFDAGEHHEPPDDKRAFHLGLNM